MYRRNGRARKDGRERKPLAFDSTKYPKPTPKIRVPLSAQNTYDVWQGLPVGSQITGQPSPTPPPHPFPGILAYDGDMSLRHPRTGFRYALEQRTLQVPTVGQVEWKHWGQQETGFAAVTYSGNVAQVLLSRRHADPRARNMCRTAGHCVHRLRAASCLQSQGRRSDATPASACATTVTLLCPSTGSNGEV